MLEGGAKGIEERSEARKRGGDGGEGRDSLRSRTLNQTGDILHLWQREEVSATCLCLQNLLGACERSDFACGAGLTGSRSARRDRRLTLQEAPSGSTLPSLRTRKNPRRIGDKRRYGESRCGVVGRREKQKRAADGARETAGRSDQSGQPG